MFLNLAERSPSGCGAQLLFGNLYGLSIVPCGAMVLGIATEMVYPENQEGYFKSSQ